MKGKVISIHPSTNKGELMKLVFGSGYRNIDSAIPKSIWDKVDDTFWFVMDYRNSFGSLVDMREEVAIIFDGELQEPIKLEI